MKEIGSEFWDIPTCTNENGLFPDNTSWFLSGRSALRAIIQDIKGKRDISTVAMPSWCCDSMIIPFLKENLKVVFYSAFADETSKKEITSKCDVTLAMDYFGYQSNTEFSDGIVIRDLTHTVFNNKHKDGSYYFGSLRKWCGFYTGGFALGVGSAQRTLGEYVRLRKKAMLMKKQYIIGETGSKDYLSLFNYAEELLDSCEIIGATQRDINVAKHIDVNFIFDKRRSNAKILLDEFSDIAIFQEMNADDCPLFVPILVPDRDKLRKYLIEHQIYCPVHWPLTGFHAINESDRQIYNEELSLVCDQRYSEDDMYRLVKEVKRGLNLC